VERAQSAAQSLAAEAAPQSGKLAALEAKAFETLGLSPDRTRRRTKSKVATSRNSRCTIPKQPMATASEEALQATVDAHEILKLNGSPSELPGRRA